MIIRLTDAQYNACLLTADDPHFPWLERAEAATKTQFDVEMPPIGWKTLLHRLEAQVFNVKGRPNRTTVGSQRRALQRVAAKLAWLEAHPAFQWRAALPGRSEDAFLAWRVNDFTWQPYPLANASAVLRIPREGSASGMAVTHWITHAPSHGAYRIGSVFDPDEHLKFVRPLRPARGA